MSAESDRRSPWVAQLVLLVGFLLITVASVFTVLVPALTDDGEEETDAAPTDAAPDPAAPPVE